MGILPQTVPNAPRSRRRWRLRLVSIGLGLLPLIAAELLLRVAGKGKASEALDPFVSVDASSPFFVLNETGDRYAIAPSRLRFFQPASFARIKGANTFRIFCLGGSTVQGRPFAPETAFSTWLELALGAADPTVDWDVINCGGASYATYRLAVILHEVLDADPDLIVLCTGHNEFLEQRTYGHLALGSGVAGTLHRAASHVRLYVAVREATGRWGQDRRIAADDRADLPGEVNTLLDLGRGLDVYVRDDAWRDDVVAHVHYSVRQMLKLARSRGVPVLALLPPRNVSRCPPFKSEHTPGLSSVDLARFEELVRSASDTPWTDAPRRCAFLEEAARLNPRHAGVHYHLGVAYQKAGLVAEGRDQFERALNEDICPLRAPAAIYAALRRAAEETGTPLIDTRRLLASADPDDLWGDSLLLDHVHPNMRGHQIIADSIVDWMASEQYVTRASEWEQAKSQSWNTHLASLDAVYFRRGEERAERLRFWTQGRALGTASPGVAGGIPASH